MKTSFLILIITINSINSFYIPDWFYQPTTYGFNYNDQNDNDNSDTDYVNSDPNEKNSNSNPSINISPGQTLNVLTPTNLNVCLKGFSKDSKGNTICIQDSSQNSRPAYEVDCVFPFQYKGVWYDTCIKVDSSSYYWCSVDKIFNSKFALCEQSCPLLARSIITGFDSGGTHTSCLPASSGVVSLFPTDSQIKQIIDSHNSVRSSVSSAADLRVVTWDFDVARVAQRKAETCTFSHDCFSCRKLVNNKTLSIGQNAYMAWGYGLNTDTLWQNVINSWAGENVNFRYGGPQNGMVGHYTQIVNNRVSRIGCGAAKCGSSIYVYCNYVGAQMDMNKPYTLATRSCSLCPSSNCVNNLCDCKKVCQNSGYLDLKTCTCQCPSYATGTECETLLCDKTDKQYGCWAKSPSDCGYTNFPPICPNLCGSCTVS